jgi:hypothetical protein
MSLYARLLLDAEGRIPIHPFSATLNEVIRGRLTEAEAATLLGFDGDPDSVQQFAALVVIITSAADPTAAALELKDILFLMESLDQYSTEPELTARVTSIA